MAFHWQYLNFLDFYDKPCLSNSLSNFLPGGLQHQKETFFGALLSVGLWHKFWNFLLHLLDLLCSVCFDYFRTMFTSEACQFWRKSQHNVCLAFAPSTYQKFPLFSTSHSANLPHYQQIGCRCFAFLTLDVPLQSLHSATYLSLMMVFILDSWLWPSLLLKGHTPLSPKHLCQGANIC